MGKKILVILFGLLVLGIIFIVVGTVSTGIGVIKKKF